MIEIHTSLAGSRWCTTVDGLRQAGAAGDRSTAVARARHLAAELGARLYVHEVDGAVDEVADYSRSTRRSVRPAPFFG